MRFLKGLLLLLVLTIVLTFVLIVDTAPDVQVSSSEQVNRADSVNTLLVQVRKVVQDRDKPHQISISEAQAQSLAGFVQRAKAQANIDINFSENRASFLLSYHLGRFVRDFYLNIAIEMQSAPGIVLESVSIGSLHLPGGFSLEALTFLFNRYTNTNAATEARVWVKKVTVSEQMLQVNLKPSAPVFAELKKINTGEEDEASIALRLRVGHYVRVLNRLPPPLESEPSLSYYLRAAMMEAQTQSAYSNASFENEAAVLALAVYAGNYRFARFIGDIGIPIDKMPTAGRKTTLAGRHDLSLHFIFSAAIKLLSEQGFSLAIGEFKELMDRGTGGTGYSFRDLAADMSGTHLAALAVKPESASKVQSLIINSSDESAFFPSIEGLEEGLDSKAFASKYQAVDSPEYQRTLALIQQRIDALAISK